MHNDKRALRVELVAACIMVIPTDMGAVAGQRLPDPLQLDAMEKPRWGLGKEHREAALRFLENVAALSIERAAVGQAELALFTIIEPPGAVWDESRRSRHRRTVVDRTAEPPLTGQRGKKTGQRRSTIIFLISAIAFAGLRFFGQVRVQFMIVWQR